MIKLWFIDRKLFKLRTKLAGRQAAIDELRRCGEGNYGIAEDIGALKFQIDFFEQKRKKVTG